MFLDYLLDATSEAGLFKLNLHRVLSSIYSNVPLAYTIEENPRFHCNFPGIYFCSIYSLHAD